MLQDRKLHAILVIMNGRSPVLGKTILDIFEGFVFPYVSV